MPRPKAAKAQAAPAQEQAPPAEEAPTSQAQEGTAPAKKKRNNNPGVRVQGGRVYDSENGTTCHQCRQKTIETKAKCTKCTLYFCPKCACREGAVLG
jgi:formamidopyrimidine-DNA glycosylase